VISELPQKNLWLDFQKLVWPSFLGKAYGLIDCFRAGGTQKLARVIGIAKAKELIYTGRRLTAQEAEKLGINILVRYHHRHLKLCWERLWISIWEKFEIGSRDIA
jgi:hypothetical protein